MKERLASLKTKYDEFGKFCRSSSYAFLLRKEVIHPHVPVGIPCYDFALITGSTLGPAPKGRDFEYFRLF